MKLIVPFSYTKAAVPPRCRNPRPMKFDAKTRITIAEVSSADAPVAIVWHTRGWRKGDFVSLSIELRWWRRQLWKLYLTPNWAERSEAPELAAEFSFPAPTHHDGDYASNRRAIQRAARNIVFIDGQRWEPCGEPRYVVMTFGLGHNHGLGWGTCLSTDTSYNGNIHRERYFRCDEREAALRETERVALERGDTKALPVEETQRPDRFEIRLPEAIRLCPSKQHGTGDPFINGIERIVKGSNSSIEAGLATMAMAIKEISR